MIFYHPSASVTFRHGPRPSGGDRAYDNNVISTSAGVVIVNTLRGGFTVWSVSWGNMPLVDRTNLEAFFDAVNGMAELWTWTWSDGTVKTVRFNSSALEFTEKSHDTYSITVELME